PFVSAWGQWGGVLWRKLHAGFAWDGYPDQRSVFINLYTKHCGVIDLKLIQCVEAYQALLSISQKEMDYQSALAMVDMMNRLKPQVDFYSGKELDLVNSYAKKKDGKIVM